MHFSIPSQRVILNEYAPLLMLSSCAQIVGHSHVANPPFNGLARVKEVQVGELAVEEMHKDECIPALRITRARIQNRFSQNT